MITVILSAAVVILLTLFYRKRKKEQLLFSELGIPGPDPHWLFGSLHMFKEKPSFIRYQEWTKTYGNFYGYFEANKPVIITTDVDIIKQVFVKQFSNFHCRKQFPTHPDPDSPKKIHMFLAQGERWKRLRSIINPTFSALKLKQMLPIINKCSDIFMKELDQQYSKGKPFDIYEHFQGLTLDVIAECALGFEVNAQQDRSNNPFLFRCRQVFSRATNLPFIALLALFIPEFNRGFRKLLAIYFYFLGDPQQWVTGKIGECVAIRRQMKQPSKVDMIQLMLDAEEVEDCASLDTPQTLTMTSQEDETVVTSGTHANVVERKRIKKALTNEEIKSQGQLFMLAGYETTSTVLGYTAYELAINPDVQQKLQKEIDQILGTDVPKYDVITTMPYLDMVISESLRLHPVAALIQARQCSRPVELNGLQIPEGTTVQVDVWSMHNDPQHWGPDTEKFQPERFTKDNTASRNPMAYMPFGIGPRNCIGMRFALMEAKTAIVRILQKYTIARCSSTQVPLQVKEGATITPKDGVIVTLELRNTTAC